MPNNNTINEAAATNTMPTPTDLPIEAMNKPLETVITDSQISTDIAEVATQSNITQIQSLFEAGGPIIMILAVMSIFAMTVFLLKTWQFFWAGISRQKMAHASLKLWHEKKYDSAIALLKNTKNPTARVLGTAMSLKVQYLSGNESVKEANDAIAREETTRIAKRELASARSYLKVLEVIATLSPLLGLLGTVLGMITAFQKLQGAGSTIDPALLSGGIWVALLTTAAGLIVAIPTVIALNWLEQRIERFKLIMEDTMTQVFTANALQLSSDSIEVKHGARKTSSNQPLSSKKDADLALAN